MDSTDTGGPIWCFYRTKSIILSFKGDFSISDFRVSNDYVYVNDIKSR